MRGKRGASTVRMLRKRPMSQSFNEKKTVVDGGGGSNGKCSFRSCMHCSRKVVGKSALAQHLKEEHSSLRPIQCPRCDWTLATRKQLHNHLKTHLKRPNPFQCTICTRTFPLKFSFARHLAKTHPGKVKLLPRPTAALSFKKKGDLNCPLCKVKYEWTRHTYHRKAMHVPCGYVACLGCMTTAKSGCTYCAAKERLRHPDKEICQTSQK